MRHWLRYNCRGSEAHPYSPPSNGRVTHSDNLTRAFFSFNFLTWLFSVRSRRKEKKKEKRKKNRERAIPAVSRRALRFLVEWRHCSTYAAYHIKLSDLPTQNWGLLERQGWKRRVIVGRRQYCAVPAPAPAPRRRRNLPERERERERELDVL